MRISSPTLLFGFALTATLSTAQAQPAPATTPVAAPAAPTAEATAAPEVPPAVEAAPAPEPGPTCFPGCRDGYLCHEGQCISACNPPCAKSEICVDGHACVPTNHYYSAGPPHGFVPWHPMPPSAMDAPPPHGSWPPPPHYIHLRKPRDYPHFQGYFGLQAGLGGKGSLRLSRDWRDSDYYGEERDFNLRNSLGAQATMEFRLFRYFGVGPSVRFLTARGDNGIGRTNRVDLLVVPIFHVPFENVEIFVPIPLGLTFGSVPNELQGDSGAGGTIGIEPGLIVWLGKSFGIFGQIGAQLHAFGYELPDTDYTISFGRATVTLGVTMRD